MSNQRKMDFTASELEKMSLNKHKSLPNHRPGSPPVTDEAKLIFSAYLKRRASQPGTVSLKILSVEFDF